MPFAQPMFRRDEDATSEGAPVWGIELGSGARASEDYACTIRAAIRNVRIDGLPPFSGE